MYLLNDSASPVLSSQRAMLENSAGQRMPVKIKIVPDKKPSSVPNLSAFDCFMNPFSPIVYQVQHEHGA